jgi:hypothetical protein
MIMIKTENGLYPKTIQTKYGNASINPRGYYRITSGIHADELLHRLIWEDINGPIPEGYIIHHKDFNKLNNDLNNLQCLTKSEHITLHHKYKEWSTESKTKASKTHKKMWTDPEYRKSQLSAIAKTFENPEILRKRNKAIKKAWEDSDRLLKQSEASKGEKNPNVILTKREVKVIKYLITTLTYKGAIKDIAIIYGVTPGVISHIKTGFSWNHVEICIPLNKTRKDGQNGKCHGVTIY